MRCFQTQSQTSQNTVCNWGNQPTITGVVGVLRIGNFHSIQVRLIRNYIYTSLSHKIKSNQIKSYHLFRSYKPQAIIRRYHPDLIWIYPSLSIAWIAGFIGSMSSNHSLCFVFIVRNFSSSFLASNWLNFLALRKANRNTGSEIIRSKKPLP